MDIKTLQTIGLTKGEAKVYLTLMKTGSTTTGALITSSGVSRSKVYDVLERLKQKGLVTEVIKQNTRYFEGTNPKRIIDYLETKQTNLSKQMEDSKKIVSNLEKLRSSNIEKQEAKVYTGIEGLRTVYDEILTELKNGGEYLAFGLGSIQIENEKLKEFIHKFHLRREEAKIPARVLLHSKTMKSPQIKDFKKLKFYRIKSNDLEFPTGIAIYNNYVLTLVWKNDIIAFVIYSKQVADNYRAYFEDLWKKSKR